MTETSIGDALAALGARSWQIAQTAQLIADAFVGSVQAVSEPSETAS
jgi:ribonuclease D